MTHKLKTAIHLLTFLFLLFIFICLLLDIHLNITPSLPIGFYQLKHSREIKRGDIVAVCLPEKITRYGLSHNYLLPGRCVSGAIPVIKKLIACPGDLVETSTRSIKVNNQVYGAIQHERDRFNQPIDLRVRPQTSRTTGYWLYGKHEHSWDSRYFGSVSHQHIIGVVRYVSLTQPEYWGEYWPEYFVYSPKMSTKNVRKLSSTICKALKNLTISSNTHWSHPLFFNMKNFLTPHSQRPPITGSGTRGGTNGCGGVYG